MEYLVITRLGIALRNGNHVFIVLDTQKDFFWDDYHKVGTDTYNRLKEIHLKSLEEKYNVYCCDLYDDNDTLGTWFLGNSQTYIPYLNSINKKLEDVKLIYIKIYTENI